MCWIGVNVNLIADEEGTLRYQLKRDYVQALREVGARPLPLLPGAEAEELDLTLGTVSGVLFIGGPDYPPSLYGEPPHPETELMHAERADFDLRLARRILNETRLPVFGICGGLQLIVVALGGALIQHLPTAERHRNPSGGGYRLHDVQIEPGTRLAAGLGAGRHRVNSFHHQAADPRRLPGTLRIAAVADDGVAEAIELKDEGRFVVGVQWHPESMEDADHRRRLFGMFLNAALACDRGATAAEKC